MKCEVYPYKRQIVFHNIFSSLNDLVTYIKEAQFSEQALNTSKLASLKDDFNFYGVPFDEALELCKYGEQNDIRNFLTLKNQLENAIMIKTQKRKVITDYSGFAPNIGAYFRGNPKAMYRLEREEAKKFITIHYNCSAAHYICKEQISNKGIITLILIKLLEDNGYRVKFNFFEISEQSSEICYNEIQLKKEYEALNSAMCYFPMTNRAFLRRIIFRVMETTNFSEYWLDTYGSTMDKDKIREILDLKENDILINSERELEIEGIDLYKDANSYFNSIGLEQYLDFSENKILTR